VFLIALQVELPVRSLALVARLLLLAWLLFLFLLWLQLLQLCSGCCAITVPSTSCCTGRGAVVAVAAVATAGAGCPGAGVATSWKLKKFGRENYNNQK